MWLLESSFDFPQAQLKMRSGIMGIERGIERKQKETNKEVNEVSFVVWEIEVGIAVIPR